MPIKNEWYDDGKTIILTTVLSPWEMKDLMKAVDEMTRMLDTVDHPVANISDYTLSERAPAGTLTHIPGIAQGADHPNFEYFVLFGIKTRLGKTITSIFERVYGKIYFAEDLESATALIAQKRAADDPDEGSPDTT